MNLIIILLIFPPILAFLLLAFLGQYFSKLLSCFIGTFSIAFSTLITIIIDFIFFKQHLVLINQILCSWIQINNHYSLDINLMLDGLSLTMLSIVTGIGFLIHLFSCWYMYNSASCSQFFAYTNLFIASMIILVLADNLLLMYLGWEIVGLCSYLLIGFYYKEAKNGAAALKALITTRIGDICLIIAIFIIYNNLGTLNLHEIALIATNNYYYESNIQYLIILLLLLFAAVGKSAQFPLQTWLATAMVGPTPVSALIHAATMVTAGVYLIVRNHLIFLLIPHILYVIGLIGAITLLLAGFAALMQTDVKKILAYSTMSQIGYMFLAIGIQAWHAAIFHLMIHAFFKALLFLSSGLLILVCNEEQNIFKMGGLYKKTPFLYICFLFGASSLAALPFFTSGYFSKEEILANILFSGYKIFIIIGFLGSFITTLYTCRMIFIVFHGKTKRNLQLINIKGIAYCFPLVIMILLSTFLGAMISLPLKNIFADNHFYYNYSKLILELSSIGIIFFGIFISVECWIKQSWKNYFLSWSKNILWSNFINLGLHGWGFDFIYKKIFINPYLMIAFLLKSDPLNQIMNMPAHICNVANKHLLSNTNNYLHRYIKSMIFATLLISIVMIIHFKYNNF
ncbi:MAG: NADH-quinone oxidoreductase subunit L [Candidatus Dasytiphilus stammeri]